jgi:putative metallohydrolase (TIGR04338 family)
MRADEGGSRVIRDNNRALVYEAEQIVHDMVDRGGTVDFHGSMLTISGDRKFADLASVQRYCDQIQACSWGFPDLSSVHVVERRGAKKAHWQPPNVIAIPMLVAGGEWSRRELVVLHEICHHVISGRRLAVDEPIHGPTFCKTHVELVRNAVSPEVGLLLQAVYDSSGAFGQPRPGGVS